MRTLSFTFSFITALSLALAAGCLDEEAPGPGEEDESAVRQEIDRGWFDMHLNGIGHIGRDAAGLAQELMVNYHNGRGYAYPYVQRMNWSPATSWLTGVVWANCSDGSQPVTSWNFLLTVQNIHTSGIPAAYCPPGTGVLDAYFYLHVDN